MDIKDAIKEFYALQSKLSAYSHAMSLLNYDGEAVAPRGTAANRAHAMGELSDEIYRLSTGKDTAELLNYLD